MKRRRGSKEKCREARQCVLSLPVSVSLLVVSSSSQHSDFLEPVFCLLHSIRHSIVLPLCFIYNMSPITLYLYHAKLWCSECFWKRITRALRPQGDSWRSWFVPLKLQCARSQNGFWNVTLRDSKSLEFEGGDIRNWTLYISGLYITHWEALQNLGLKNLLTCSGRKRSILVRTTQLHPIIGLFTQQA